MSRILGIDQALQTTGCAIFNDGKLEESFIFEVPPHKPMEERLALFFKELVEIDKKYEIDKIVFEDIQLQRNAVTFKHLSYVQAALLMFCYYNQLDYEIYKPSEWRKILGGGFGKKREEQKQHAQDLVKDKFNIEVSSDQADAICIGLAYHAEQQNNVSGFPAPKKK